MTHQRCSTLQKIHLIFLIDADRNLGNMYENGYQKCEIMVEKNNVIRLNLWMWAQMQIFCI